MHELFLINREQVSLARNEIILVEIGTGRRHRPILDMIVRSVFMIVADAIAFEVDPLVVWLRPTVIVVAAIRRVIGEIAVPGPVSFRQPAKLW